LVTVDTTESPRFDVDMTGWPLQGCEGRPIDQDEMSLSLGKRIVTKAAYLGADQRDSQEGRTIQGRLEDASEALRREY